MELDREDMKHHEFMLITDFRLHLSPIGDNPQRILDVGTGTGGLIYAVVSIDQNEAENPTGLWAIQAGKSCHMHLRRTEGR